MIKYIHVVIDIFLIAIGVLYNYRVLYYLHRVWGHELSRGGHVMQEARGIGVKLNQPIPQEQSRVVYLHIFVNYLPLPINNPVFQVLFPLVLSPYIKLEISDGKKSRPVGNNYGSM